MFPDPKPLINLTCPYLELIKFSPSSKVYKTQLFAGHLSMPNTTPGMHSLTTSRNHLGLTLRPYIGTLNCTNYKPN